MSFLNNHRDLLCKSLLLLLIIFQVYCKENSSKKELLQTANTVSDKQLRHICLSDEEFVLFRAGTTANSEKFFWGIANDINLSSNICKLSLTDKDNYTFLLNKGQGPGEIKSWINNIWFSSNCFILSEASKFKPLMFFDKEFNYLMDIHGLNVSINDLIFNEETGELLTIIDPIGTYSSQTNKGKIWQEPEQWQEYATVSLYQIENNTAKLNSNLLYLNQVKNMFKKNNFNLYNKQIASLQMKFINNYNIILSHYKCPFFLIYNLKTKNLKRVVHKINNHNKKKINSINNFTYYSQNSLNISNKYIYFAQNNLSHSIKDRNPDYSIFRYKLNGEYDCKVESINKFSGLKNKYIMCLNLFITKKDKILATEAVFEKTKKQPIATQVAFYNFNKLIKNNTSK